MKGRGVGRTERLDGLCFEVLMAEQGAEAKKGGGGVFLVVVFSSVIRSLFAC